ncbi:NTP transferase domain-containing protein, partial [Acidobacteriota bacterium]
NGLPLVRRCVEIYESSRADPVIVVVGYERQRIQDSLKGLPLMIRFNQNFKSGKASSIACGLEALPAGTRAVLFAQADMPFVEVSTVNLLLNAYDGPDKIIVPLYKGQPGSPKLFGSDYFKALSDLLGEQTGMKIIRKNRPNVIYVETCDPGILIDLDKASDFKAHCEGNHG